MSGKRKRISSKPKATNKLFWKSFIIVVVLTVIYILLMWNKDSELLKALEMKKILDAYDKFMSYVMSPIFVGFIIFSLDLMKEIDDEQWKRQEQEETREKERKSSNR